MQPPCLRGRPSSVASTTPSFVVVVVFLARLLLLLRPPSPFPPLLPPSHTRSKHPRRRQHGTGYLVRRLGLACLLLWNQLSRPHPRPLDHLHTSAGTERSVHACTLVIQTHRHPSITSKHHLSHLVPPPLTLPRPRGIPLRLLRMPRQQHSQA